MPVVCMINRKGGVGKTTLTLALADFLSVLKGKRILVIDLDPQANASLSLLGEDEWARVDTTRRTVADLMERVITSGDVRPDWLDSLVLRSVGRVRFSLGEISLIASTPRLQEVEEGMAEGDPQWRYNVGSPYMILHQCLARHVVSAYDYVLIDCPPAIGVVTLNGLTLANGYLIPTIPDHVSTVGVAQLVGRIETHARFLRRGTAFKRYGTIVNRFRQGTRLHDVKLAEMRNKPEYQPVWNTLVPQSVKGEEAYNPDARETTLAGLYGSRTAKLYIQLEALADEFLRRVV